MLPKANQYRGEVDLVLLGESYVLRPSFTALSLIEKRLQTGLFLLAEKIADETITLNEIKVILECCCPDLSNAAWLDEAMVHTGLERLHDHMAMLFVAIICGRPVNA